MLPVAVAVLVNWRLQPKARFECHAARIVSENADGIGDLRLLRDKEEGRSLLAAPLMLSLSVVG